MKDARIAILGMGPIGLSVLYPALMDGVGAVYATDRIDHRVNFAREQGATWAGNPDSEDIVAAIQQAQPALLDAVFECCGQQQAIDQALELLKPGGKLMLIGIPSVQNLSFNMDLMRRKEICVQNVRRQNECVEKTLHMLESGVVDVKPMATHHFPFERTQEAFDLVHHYEDGVVKAMVCFQ